MARLCLRCNGTDWLPWHHWLICRNCDAKLADQIVASQPARFPKPELFDKGIPSKPGG